MHNLKLNIKIKLISLPLLISTLISCGTRENDAPVLTVDDFAITLEQTVDHTVIAASENFTQRSIKMQDAIENFCLNFDNASLVGAQSEWRQLNEAWFSLANFNFGPLNDDLIFPAYTFIDSLRLRGTNYIATARSEIQQNISENTALDTAFFNQQTFQKIGLLALEVALFETADNEQNTSSSAIIANFQKYPRKCEIIDGLSANLLQRAQYVQNGWKVNHLQTGEAYRQLLLSNRLEDGTEPLNRILTAVQEHLDYLQKRSVVSVSATLAQHSWQNINAAINTIEQLLNGSEKSTHSLFKLMTLATGELAVTTVKNNLQTAKNSITAQDSTALAIALSRLDGNFKREIPDALDVELGINFTDGD